MWYYVLDGEGHGPVSEDEVHNLIQDGALDSGSYVWTAEMDDWKPISEVDQLVPRPPPIPSDAVDDAEQGKRENKVAIPATPYKPSQDDGQPGQEGNQHEYASFLDRFMALLIDLLLLSLLGGLILGVVEQASSTASPVVRIGATVIGAFYYVLFEGSSVQKTPGKDIVGLKVTDLDHNQIGYGRALGRYLGRILSTLPLLLGYLAPLFTEKKQTFHDYVAGCLVMKE